MSRELYIRNFYMYQNTCEDLMGAKRFKDQILAQILKACEGEGKSKTKVVYASGLNFKTIGPYLITLNKNGLIEIIPGEYSLYGIIQTSDEAQTHLQVLVELVPEFVHAEIETLEFASPGLIKDKHCKLDGLELKTVADRRVARACACGRGPAHGRVLAVSYWG